MIAYLDFEKSVAELEGKAQELRALAIEGDQDGVDISEDIARLSQKAEKQIADLYEKLTPWQKCQVARHPDRPHSMAYVDRLIDGFTPLAGDRAFSEDNAVIGGMGRFKGRNVMVIGHEKGEDTQSRLKRNFGMARPEGYRKAIRLMDMADRFNLPMIALIDTPGAYPGKGAEERGQAEAIARSTEKCLMMGTPLISAIVGEGGSGGAVAFATANKVIMMQHAIYSVISPEGCASILWKNSEKNQDAAAALRLTAQDLMKLGVIDQIASEPTGGAQRNKEAAIDALGDEIEIALKQFDGMSPDEIKRQRREKFLAMGEKKL